MVRGQIEVPSRISINFTIHFSTLHAFSLIHFEVRITKPKSYIKHKPHRSDLRTTMPTMTSKARLFHLERLAFREHCNDVALFILGNAELSIAELNDFIVELRAHVTVLWLAGNMLLRDCNPDDLAHLPPGFMTGMQPRLGRSPMTEFAWGCFQPRSRSQARLHTCHEPGWQVCQVIGVAVAEKHIAGKPENGDMGAELPDEVVGLSDAQFRVAQDKEGNVVAMVDESPTLLVKEKGFRAHDRHGGFEMRYEVRRLDWIGEVDV
ncbi:uncharacterized protein N7515_000657 [Penicillium bovifimosum]|uniref:Uncharacterized protein n=1 Tax=Penicillium bovifimosum TaxID=126998 RepID=A0A9W9LBR9_9EURO|nr:uncharacterized protein N7515_000657 [Penicillium bovifimosum]KAJ5146093.1 hypothetical protein N7515_000657 [Penicillium bovifimosum]